jgi:hypothetical protein
LKDKHEYNIDLDLLLDDNRVKDIIDKINPTKKNVDAENLRQSKIVTKEKLNDLKLTKMEIQKE